MSRHIKCSTSTFFTITAFTIPALPGTKEIKVKLSDPKFFVLVSFFFFFLLNTWSYWCNIFPDQLSVLPHSLRFTLMHGVNSHLCKSTWICYSTNGWHHPRLPEPPITLHASPSDWGACGPIYQQSLLNLCMLPGQRLKKPQNIFFSFPWTSHQNQKVLKVE